MTLTTPAQLAAMLGDDVVVLDARWSGPAGPDTGKDEFEKGHIPGAQWVSVDEELADASRGIGRHPLPSPHDFQADMRRHGVSNGSRVVVMDGANSQAAGRLWWMLKDAGVDSVVLNGGFLAWQAAGFPVETGPAVIPEPGDIELHPGQLPQADSDEVAQTTVNLWDVRGAERYRGESEPIDPIAGHVPGAKSLPEGLCHRPDGRFLPAAELQAVFAGVAPGDIVYCGSGMTASQALLAMHSAGIDGVKLWPGSWSEWSRTDPARPVETGDQR